MDTYAFCLMRNHFHLLVRIKSEQEWRVKLAPEYQKGKVAFSPSQFNTMNRRTGSLFEERFKRIEVTSDTYFTNLIFYIHFNPQKHGFVNDFREWPWSSFGALRGGMPTKLQRKNVLDWFEGRDKFGEFHRGAVDERKIAAIIEDDFI